MVKASSIGYKAGTRDLLRDLNFEVNGGEHLAVIGANGAGKSTLLRLLSRELLPATGMLELKEKPMNSYSIAALAKLRAVLSQQNSVSIPFSVFELVMMGRYPYYDNTPSVKDMDIVHNVLSLMNIHQLHDRDYNTLSGGEQQRVQFARTLAQVYDQRRALLLLDEPTNGLDLLFQHQLLALARQMADQGFAVISILHDMNFASRYSDKVLMLKDGGMVSYGRPETCLSPANIREAFGLDVLVIQEEKLYNPLIIPEIYYR